MAFQTDAGTIGLWRFEDVDGTTQFQLAAVIAAWNSDCGLDHHNDTPPTFGLELVVTRTDGTNKYVPGKDLKNFVVTKFGSTAGPWPDYLSPDMKVDAALAKMRSVFFANVATGDLKDYRVDVAFDYVDVGTTGIPDLVNTQNDYKWDVYPSKATDRSIVGKFYSNIDQTGAPYSFSEQMKVESIKGMRHRIPFDMQSLVFLPKDAVPLVDKTIERKVGAWVRAHSYVRTDFHAEWPKWAPYQTMTKDEPANYGKPQNNTKPRFTKYSDFLGHLADKNNQQEAKEGQINKDPMNITAP